MSVVSDREPRDAATIDLAKGESIELTRTTEGRLALVLHQEQP